MTMFGRDSIFTSLQALPFTPELAATTLGALGNWQGSRLDDFRDEDPGRILHEMRYGEMTAFEERPHSPYYGAVDATPLYVVLLDEYERWTGDRKLVRDLEHEARAALNWIDEYADLQGTGYIWYRRRNEETGLENQCWKDSWDSISFRDGRLPGFPRATCELQGYAYDAKVRGARLAREIWKDRDLADRLEKEAADLKRRFNRDFWVEDGEYFALALDPDGNQVDALASNNGHLLWSGIVDKSKAKAVAQHLLGPRLFSGWGVRTLAEGEGRYNPIGYHVGTVWPFDNSFIAWGLRRYGFKDEAAEIAAGHPRRRGVLRGSAARGVRRLRARTDEVPSAVPDRVQPAGVVDRDAAAAAADDARARAAGRPPRRRPGASARHRPPRAARHPWPLGSHRRVRPRPRGRPAEATSAPLTSVVLGVRLPADENSGADGARQISELRAEHDRRAVRHEQVRGHLLDDLIDERLTEPVAEAAADDDRLQVEEVLRRCETDAQSPRGVVDQLLRHSIALLERARLDARAEPVAAALSMIPNRFVLCPRLTSAARALHARPSGVGLEAAAPAAGAPQPAGPDDHVTELPAGAPAVAELALEDEAPADAGADPDAEQVLVRATRAARVGAEDADLTSLPT